MLVLYSTELFVFGKMNKFIEVVRYKDDMARKLCYLSDILSEKL